MPRIPVPLLEVCARPPVMGAAFVSLIVLVSIVLSTHSFLALFSLEGVLIVVGGVLAVAFMSFQRDDVQRALRAISEMFTEPRTPRENLHRDMMEIIAWATVIREKGMRGFEANIVKSGIDDPFVKYGVNMAVSGYAAEEVRVMMETAADACHDVDSAPIAVLHAMASHAPAFGMIGTLVGMVSMLCNLTDNMSSIGSSLAVSFLSTLYGVISARMVYLPAASRLQQKIDRRHFRHHLITEGMVMLAGNKNPMHIQDHLNSFLRPETRDYFDYFNAGDNRPARISGAAARAPLKIVSA